MLLYIILPDIFSSQAAYIILELYQINIKNRIMIDIITKFDGELSINYENIRILNDQILILYVLCHTCLRLCRVYT